MATKHATIKLVISGDNRRAKPSRLTRLLARAGAR